MASFQGKKINPKKFHPSQIKFYIFLIPFAIFMAIPIVYMFTTAFKPQEELFKFPPSILVYNPTMDNFKSLFDLFEDLGLNTNNESVVEIIDLIEDDIMKAAILRY